MRILYVCHSFYPCLTSGGVVRSSFELAKEMVRRGHDVTVFTTDGCQNRLRTIRNKKVDVDGISVYYFSNLSNLLRMKWKIATPIALPAIAAEIIDSFDIIHIHEHRTTLAAFIASIARNKGIPLVIQAHGSLPGYSRKRQAHLFDLFIGKRILKMATKCIALTENELEQYIKCDVPAARIEIIGNGIELIELSGEGKGKLRKTIGIESDDFLIIFLGRINKIKGLDMLLDSFEKVLQSKTNCYLLIVGPDDGYKSHLEEIINKRGMASNIQILPPILDAIDKFNAISDSDLLVLSSEYEAFPMVVLEAWNCRRPVVITANCGISNFASKGGIVTRYDSDEFAGAILHLANDFSLRDSLGREGRRIVEESFDIRAIANKYEMLYFSIGKDDERGKYHG